MFKQRKQCACVVNPHVQHILVRKGSEIKMCNRAYQCVLDNCGGLSGQNSAIKVIKPPISKTKYNEPTENVPPTVPRSNDFVPLKG